ncbi:hypothetical protein FisN_23Hh205 [Fistulifera solaris]|jgi:hypothetical protein|uniref:Uncharacterized protein n=1 Tax=Fistulifera solaris TaxID=1519565 RepID=A0A1Z5JWT0_FISSO|nr:hypothetical protein FisN_23Hh205 [Fistulifera solaris]|eukprot:GAX18312.1 hypothetical protein FisN_23Hh205 [Fistulifera solaris]
MTIFNLLSIILLSWIFRAAFAEDWKPRVNLDSQAELFSPCENITVLAPSVFPKPTHWLGENVTIIVEPTFGHHRPAQDAIFAYAEGYRLSYYMMFMETLTATGFRGDVVLAVADEYTIREDVMDYLKTFTDQDSEEKPNLIIYQETLLCESSDGDPTNTRRNVVKTGDTDSFQMCQLPNVYGWVDSDGHVLRAASDPREGRVVATIRYEYYWIWSQRYNRHSWLMLIDARDSYFQLNPFQGLPRSREDQEDGLLYLFGENSDATRLGRSKKNLKWIQKGYGQRAIDLLAEKPTICSGSTMGEQVAVEAYLRAMVNEHDECNIRMTGSDQGFHNYLYYSSKLRNTNAIRRLVVWEQGRGIINNLGALRTQTLSEWGILDPVSKEVYQWDGTISPVVHQWDRDRELHSYIWNKRHVAWAQEWKDKKMNATSELSSVRAVDEPQNFDLKVDSTKQSDVA